MRFLLALYIAKFTRILILVFGKIFKFNGSHFPGNVAVKICPNFLSKIGKPKTIITVTGTNGKTTTCNLIIDILEKNNYKVLNNRFGSNVRGGITTTLLSGVSLFNKSKYDIAVIEVDERSSERIYKYVKPTYAVITNLFRDSLKRNAHSEFIYKIIEDSMPDSPILVLNADDLISNKMKENENKRVYFGIDKQPGDKKETFNIVNDAQICPKCYAKLKYDFIRYHHIGKAYCTNCGYKSPEADYLVKTIDYNNLKMKIFDKKENKDYEINLVSDSIFNVYNQIAAITVLAEFGLSIEKINDAFKEIEITKDRYKKEVINDVEIINHLAKGQNPVACSIVFKYVKEEKGNKEIVLVFEDYHDNKESSENMAWIYDCDFEFLNDDSIKKIVIPGERSKDIKLRAMLAGVPEDRLIAIDDETKVTDYLSFNKDNTIYILYDMYQQPAVDRINKMIKEKLTGGDK